MAPGIMLSDVHESICDFNGFYSNGEVKAITDNQVFIGVLKCS